MGSLSWANATPLPGWVQRLVGIVGPAAGPATLFALGGLMASCPSCQAWSHAQSVAAAEVARYPVLGEVLLAHVLLLDPF